MKIRKYEVRDKVLATIQKNNSIYTLQGEIVKVNKHNKYVVKIQEEEYSLYYKDLYPDEFPEDVEEEYLYDNFDDYFVS